MNALHPVPPPEPQPPAEVMSELRPRRPWGRYFLTIAGALTAVPSLGGMVFFLLSDLRGVEPDVYRGMVAFMVLPGVLVIGLVLLVAGVLSRWWGERPLGRGLRLEVERPPNVFNFGAFSLVALTVLVVLGATGYRAVEYMDSATFCSTCHSVMEPQVEAHVRSPHAEVACTACHIGPDAGPVGPGAGAYAEAKLGGMRQTLSVLLNNYHRPVRAPQEKVPLASETCVECHAPETDYGMTVRVYRSYLPDEANTRHTRVLAFRVGGGDDRDGATTIHWHATARLWYSATDESHQTVTWAGLETPDGMKEWVNPGAPPELDADRRLMDCVDCHNRVGHRIASPGELVDRAIEDGRLDASLPYLKREALWLLGAEGAGVAPEVQAERARQPGWFEQLRRYYVETYPDLAASRGGAISGAIEELKRISEQTLYPKMRTSWLTYPDNLQHSLPEGLESGEQTTPGCFRCHGTLVEAGTGERLAGTLGGDGCLACHGLGEDGQIRPDATEPGGSEACALCHVNLSEEQMQEWLPEASSPPP